MARKTQVVGFSLPPEINQKVEKLLEKKHKTRSEFMREVIDLYFETANSTKEKPVNLDLQEPDFAKILQSYWLLKSATNLKTICVGLGIIVNEDGKVLIGARKAKDKWVKNLTWVFPGGLLETLDFEKDLKAEIKQETGLEAEVKSLIAARMHPDAGFKNVQVVALYFYCPVASGKQAVRAGGDLAKLAWVKPTDVFKYFTTSTSDEVAKFLAALEYSNN